MCKVVKFAAADEGGCRRAVLLSFMHNASEGRIARVGKRVVAVGLEVVDHAGRGTNSMGCDRREYDDGT